MLNEFDFSQLQQLRTPENWVEAAVHIPQEKQKPRLLRFRPYSVGAVAVLVIVAVTLLTLLLQTGQTTCFIRSSSKFWIFRKIKHP